MKTDANKTGIEPEPRSGSLDAVVRLQGYRVKLKDRRVFAAIGPDGDVWLKWVKLQGKERKVAGVRLTPEAAAATAAAIMDALNELMRNGTGRQPNDQAQRPALGGKDKRE